MTRCDVAVVGGGIGGLTTAYRLLQARGDWRITVIESSQRLGGVIGSHRHEGMLLEAGPDSIVTAKPAGIALIRELGLEDDVVGIPADARGALIARGRRLHKVPEGLYLLAPGRIWPFVCSPIVGPLGKLRMLCDLLLPRRSGDAPEESLAQFVMRRLGREALDRLAQPMVGGIYTADPRHLSVAATMPQFLDMEREHRSLIMAMRARAKIQAGTAVASGPRYGLFASLRGGVQQLTDTLANRLGAASTVQLRCGLGLRSLVRHADGSWELQCADGSVITAACVALCLPAHAAAAVLEGVDSDLAAALGSVPYAGAGTVNLAFRAGDISTKLPGAAGFVVPAIEGRHLIACTFADRKYPGRVGDGVRLLRAFVGGALHPQALAVSDDEIVARCLRDLRDLGVLVGKDPWYSSVHRWPNAMAQYHLGHLDRVRTMRQREAALPGMVLVGNAYEGVGIPDIIAQASAAATRLLAAAAPSSHMA